MSRATETTKDGIPNKLVNLAECEELIQENKNEKVQRDAEYIQHHIKYIKGKEDRFYMSLNLDTQFKKRLFKIDETKMKDEYPSNEKEKLFILQHPIDGNLILSKSELDQYGDKILKNSNAVSHQ